MERERDCKENFVPSLHLFVLSCLVSCVLDFFTDLPDIITYKSLMQKLMFHRETQDLCISLKCVYVKNCKDNVGFGSCWRMCASEEELNFR